MLKAIAKFIEIFKRKSRTFSKITDFLKIFDINDFTLNGSTTAKILVLPNIQVLLDHDIPQQNFLQKAASIGGAGKPLKLEKLKIF